MKKSNITKEKSKIKKNNVVIILIKNKYQSLGKCKFRWCKNSEIKDKIGIMSLSFVKKTNSNLGKIRLWI